MGFDTEKQQCCNNHCRADRREYDEENRTVDWAIVSDHQGPIASAPQTV